MKRKKIIAIMIMLSLPLISTAQPVLEWAKSFGSTGEDRARKIINDANGNLYVVGLFEGTVDFNPGPGVDILVELGGRDAYILKLDANGNFMWVKGIHGTLTDMIADITLDSTGNIYVTGYFQGVTDFDPDATGVYSLTSVGGLDAFIAKYDVNGDFVWAHSFGSSTFENGNSIDVDHDGNVVFCGYFTGTVDFDPSPTSTFNLTSAGANEIFICKWTMNGDFIWAKRVGGTGNDIANGLVCDKAGNVYTTGVFTGSVDFDPGLGVSGLTGAGAEDAFILKLDSAGNYIWAVRFGAGNADYGYDIGLNAANNVYSTGSFANTVDFNPASGTGNVYNIASAGLKDVYFSKLDSNGAFIWAKAIGGTSNDDGFGVYVKPSGEVLFSGYISGTVDMDPGAPVYNVTASGTPVSQDIFGLKLDAAGDFVFGLGIGDLGMDVGFDILEDATGSVYLAGCFFYTPDFDPGPLLYPLTSAGNLDIFLAKYNANVFVGTNDKENEDNGILIYPNPFTNMTTIAFTEEQKNSTIKILDLLGKEIKTLVFTGKRLIIDKEDLVNGIYFVQITDENMKVVTKKIILQ
jgi:hypothetical protein